MKIQSAKAGIGTGRAGLQAASGLFSNAGLFDKGVKSFNPLDLDPYLLFDAQTSMIGTLENPTLDLDPSKQDTLDVITATRAGTATFTDVNGNIASAPANTVRVDQTQGAELTPTVYQHIGYTDFSSGWSGIRTETEQGANHLGFPSRRITRINESSSSAGNYFTVPTSLTDGQTYRYSLYIRRITGTSDIKLRHRHAVEGSDTLVSVTEDWQRFEVSATKAVGSNIQFGVLIEDFGDQIEIAMPQVEEGTTASSFVANTTGSPKFITGATFGPRVPMILVEPSATNLVTYSEDFSQSTWDKQSGGTGVAPAITSNDTIAPDGTQSADKVVFNKGSADDPSNYSILSDAFPSQQNTASLFIKADTNQRIVIRNSSSWVAYDVTTEWTRIEQTDTGGFFQIGLRDGYGIPNVPDTATVYLWGAQVETGSVATSYIPTSGSTAQRAKDDLVISGSAFSDFYNASEGTVYTESVGRGYFDFNSVFAISDNSFNESIYQRTPSNNQVLVVIDGGNVQASLGSPTTPTGTLVRRAASFKLNNFKGSHDGVDTNSDTSGTIPTVNRLHIGASASGANKLNGHLKRLIYWPTHSSRM